VIHLTFSPPVIPPCFPRRGDFNPTDRIKVNKLGNSVLARIRIRCDLPWLIVSCRRRRRRDRLLLIEDVMLFVFRRRLITLSVSVTRIGMIDRRILSVLSIVLGLVPSAGDAVAGQGRWGHVYPRTDRLEAAPGRAVLDLAYIPSVVHKAVLTVNLAGRILGLDLIRAVRRLVAVTVAAVPIVPGENNVIKSYI